MESTKVSRTSSLSFRFFFQAEDGIRDLTVTGVQTCALPIYRCHSCHSASATKLKGGLRLDSLDAALKGGDTGPAIIPGNPEKSLLVEAVSRSEERRVGKECRSRWSPYH